MFQFIQALKKNSVFRFMSSVRMAVPLMVVLGVVVAIGTVYESLYSAQVASILIYRATWFQALLGLLWLNILCAALSRIPYKIHHTGFVITHIGLLTLLIGAQITASYGIDGQLRVPEGESNRKVSLPELTLKAVSAKANVSLDYKLKRSLSPKTESQLGFSELKSRTGIIVDRFLPYVSVEQGYSDNPAAPAAVALQFHLKGPFFGTSEWLHINDRPEAQMGPAIFKLVIDDAAKAPSAGNPKAEVAPKLGSPISTMPALVIKDTSGQEIGRVSIKDLRGKPQTVKGVKLIFERLLDNAQVSDNKLVDRGAPAINPAVEFKVEFKGKKLREVAFAKFPEFSLLQGNGLGVSFAYEIPGLSGAGEVEQTAAPQNELKDELKNRVEFHVPSSVAGHEGSGLGQGNQAITIALYKNGSQVSSKKVAIGEVLQTPWMGIEIKVESVLSHGATTETIKAVEEAPKGGFLPSAVFMRTEGAAPDKGVWIVEGDFKNIQTQLGSFDLYYGEDSIDLPFSIHLDQFRKKDYPGSETPMSFESTIRLEGIAEPVEVKMNEPYRHQGYLFYQSSYELNPGSPAASIFSVNKDPGRIIKYLGAIILMAGIVIFTVMRSRMYLDFTASRRQQRA